MKKKLECPDQKNCKNTKKFKTKINYPFGKNSKGRLTKAICKECGKRVI